MVGVLRRLRGAAVAGLVLGALGSASAVAQKSPLGNQDNGGLNGSLSRSDLEKLGAIMARAARRPRLRSRARS